MRNCKGFIASSLLYGMLSLFLILILGVLAIFANRKLIMDKFKSEIITTLETGTESAKKPKCDMTATSYTNDKVTVKVRCTDANATVDHYEFRYEEADYKNTGKNASYTFNSVAISTFSARVYGKNGEFSDVTLSSDRIDEIYKGMVENLENKMKSIKTCVYPVGSIYMSFSNANPATTIGGTWEPFSQGKLIIGVGGSTDSNGTSAIFQIGGTGGTLAQSVSTKTMENTTGVSGKLLLDSVANNNLEPYITVYMWKRKA